MPQKLMRAATWLAAGATVYLTYLAMIPIVQPTEVAAAKNPAKARDMFTIPDVMRRMPPSPEKEAAIIRLLRTYDRLVMNNSPSLPPAVVIDCMARLYFDPRDPSAAPNTNPAPLIQYLTTYRESKNATVRSAADKWTSFTTTLIP